MEEMNFTNEETMLDKFEQAQKVLIELEVFVADEITCTEDVQLMPDLESARTMIADCAEIIKRARQKTEGTLKGHMTARVVLSAMGEYFTVDPTAPQLRYTGVPEEHRR